MTDKHQKVDILLIEDDQGDQELTIEYITREAEGCHIKATASTLAEALEELNRNIFQLILLDMSLPDSKGKDTFFKVRDVVGEVPIVMLTGQKDEEFALEMIKAGAADYLVKGEFESHTLVRLIRYAYERKLFLEEQSTFQDQRMTIERKLAAITEAIPGVVYQYVNYPDGWQTFTYMSKRCKELFGVSNDDAVADFSKIWNLIHPEDVPAVEEATKRCFESLEDWRVDFRVNVPDHGMRWIRGQAIAEGTRPDGSVVWNGILTDVTLERSSHERIEENYQFFRQVLDACPDIIFVKDEQSTIHFANKALCEYYGKTYDELLSYQDKELKTEDEHKNYSDDDRKVFASKEFLDIPEEPIKRHDGVVRAFHTVKSPIFEKDGQVKLLVGISRDITESKKAEKKLLDTLDELKTYKKLTVDRELAMIELKKKINDLLLKNGQPVEFDVSEEE